MATKDVILRQLKVSMEVTVKEIDTYFSTQIIQKLCKIPDDIAYIEAYSLDSDDATLIATKFNRDKEYIDVIESDWSGKIFEYANVTGDRGVIWSRRLLEEDPKISTSFILRELIRLKLVKVLVTENDDGDINAYIGNVDGVSNQWEKILSEQWNNVYGDEDPYQEDVGITNEMVGQLWETGFSAVIVDGEHAW